MAAATEVEALEVLNTMVKEGAMVGNGVEDTVAEATQVAMAMEEAVGTAMVALAAVAEEVLVASVFLEAAKVNMADAEAVVATEVAAFELVLDNLCSAFRSKNFLCKVFLEEFLDIIVTEHTKRDTERLCVFWHSRIFKD